MTLARRCRATPSRSGTASTKGASERPGATTSSRWSPGPQPAFFNGPTGPTLKTQWTEPIRWSEDWRDHAYAVPAGGALGTGATDFFCGAVAAGSNTVRRMAVNPLPVVVALFVLLALRVLGVSRATWGPSTPLRLARRRAWGQILTAAARLYVKRILLFVGIGVLFVPLSVVVTLS